MRNVGTAQEQVWGWDVSGDAQTLLGGLADSPFEAALALLVLLAIAVAVTARGPAPAPTERASAPLREGMPPALGGTASNVILTNASVPVDCTSTASTGIGATCSVNTTANGLIPNAIREGKQNVLSVFRIRLDDSAPDGVRGNGDDKLFAQRGIFNP